MMKISGYASRFGERDSSGDQVHRGAFAASILARQAPLPMLSDHQRQIGVWDRVVEDRTGLFVEGQVTDPALRRLIRKGRVRGLSIGYRTRRARPMGPARGTRRDLFELDLREVSVVAFPMLGTARIDRIVDDQTETERTDHRRLA